MLMWLFLVITKYSDRCAVWFGNYLSQARVTCPGCRYTVIRNGPLRSHSHSTGTDQGTCRPLQCFVRCRATEVRILFLMRCQFSCVRLVTRQSESRSRRCASHVGQRKRKQFGIANGNGPSSCLSIWQAMLSAPASCSPRITDCSSQHWPLQGLCNNYFIY